jgi:hypothetical protein
VGFQTRTVIFMPDNLEQIWTIYSDSVLPEKKVEIDRVGISTPAILLTQEKPSFDTYNSNIMALDQSRIMLRRSGRVYTVE